MLTPIKVNRNLIYQTSSGPCTVTPHSFGYAALQSSPVVSEARLKELITPPPLPDGLFMVYLAPAALQVVHIPNDKPECCYLVQNSSFNLCRFAALQLGDLYGLYPSFDAIIFAFPEYFI